MLGFMAFSSFAAAERSAPRFIPYDEAFRRRIDEERARFALKGYENILKADPGDGEAGWRLAMADYYVGNRFEKEKDSKTRYFAEGRDVALRANELIADCAPCRFWAAVNMALYGENIGILRMLFSVKRVRELLKQSAELDPTYAYGGAYRVLALVDQRLPGILGGSDSVARTNFERAIAAAPDEPLNYLGLTRLLDENYEDKEAAIRVARKGASIASLKPERVESLEAREELKSYLEVNKLAAALIPLPQ